MIAPLGLSNLMTVIVAVTCLTTVLPQTRGNIVKIWRLALPPSLAMVEALMLLAGVFEATFASDGEWLVAALIGAVFGRLRGWSLPVAVDRTSDLMRQRPTSDGAIAASALVLLSLVDFASAAWREALIEPDHIAAASALFAGFLVGRALAIAVRTTRLPHIELRRA